MTEQEALAEAIEALSDISYRGRDTGMGLARVFVDRLIELGWERDRHSSREAAPSDTDREALIEAAVKAVTPNFPNETAAWNAWNNLNSSPAFITAIQVLHPQSCEHGIVLSDLCSYAETIANGPVQGEVTEPIGAKVAELSEWIDGSYPESMIGTELHVRRRVDKLMEESGEVGQAVGGWFGENPRKGVTHTRADVLAELLDVAVTALGAYESLTGNAGSSVPALDAKLDMILERAGLSAALGGGDHE